MAKKFYDNPDGPCAKPINQSMEMCARIKNRTGALKYPTRKAASLSTPKNTTWVGNVSFTRRSITNDRDAQRVCPISVCKSMPWTGRWRPEPLQVFRQPESGWVGYYDSSCECFLKKP
jgi:hypothetical protein